MPHRRRPVPPVLIALTLALAACASLEPMADDELASLEQEVAVTSIQSCDQYPAGSPRESKLIPYQVAGVTPQNCDPTIGCGPITPSTKSVALGWFDKGAKITLGNCGMPDTYEGSRFGMGSSDVELRTGANGGGALLASATSGCGSNGRFLIWQYTVPSSGNLYLNMKNSTTTTSTGMFRVVHDSTGSWLRSYDLAPGASQSFTLTASDLVREAGTSVTVGNCGMPGALKYAGNARVSIENALGQPLATSAGGCGKADFARISTVLHRRTSPHYRVMCPSTSVGNCRGEISVAVRLDSNPALDDPEAAFLAIGGTQTGSSQGKERVGPSDWRLTCPGCENGFGYWVSTSSPGRLDEDMCRSIGIDYEHYQGVQRTRDGTFVLSDNADAALTMFAPYVAPRPWQSIYSLRDAIRDPQHPSSYRAGPVYRTLETDNWSRFVPDDAGDHLGGTQLLGNLLFAIHSFDYDVNTLQRTVKVFDVSANAGQSACGQFDLKEVDASSSRNKKGGAIAAARMFDNYYPSGDRVIMGVYDDGETCANNLCVAPRISFYQKKADSDGYVDPSTHDGWESMGYWRYEESPYYECDGATGVCAPHQPILEGGGWGGPGSITNSIPKMQSINFVASRFNELYMVGFSRGHNDNMVGCTLAGDDCRSYMLLFKVEFANPSTCAGASCVRLSRMWTIDVGSYADYMRSIDAAGAFIDGDNQRLLAYMAGKYPEENDCNYLYLREF